MTREIKFRAWDGEKMTPAATLQELIKWSLSKEAGYSPELDKGIFMQFTGLRDKNGVEIYEGDIVRMSGGENYTVVFKAPQFTVDWPNLWLHSGDEVIGNIYENPELVKGSHE